MRGLSERRLKLERINLVVSNFLSEAHGCHDPFSDSNCTLSEDRILAGHSRNGWRSS